MREAPEHSDKSTQDFYLRMYTEFGPTPQGLGWGKKDLQSLRFEALSRFWDFRERVILDLGCGVCDLYKFVEPKGIARYIGIDFVDAYCEFAREHFSDSNFEIVNQDLFSDQPLPICDIALASGAFNVMDFESEEENYSAIECLMKKLRVACKVGFSVNFLSDATTFRDKNLFYANSEKILSIARGLSRRLLISHFEFPFEYTLHVWCDDTYEPSSSLYHRSWPPQ
jgi:SAM-dependent methyltransferase